LKGKGKERKREKTKSVLPPWLTYQLNRGGSGIVIHLKRINEKERKEKEGGKKKKGKEGESRNFVDSPSSMTFPAIGLVGKKKKEGGKVM